MAQHYRVITFWPDLDGARQQANRWVPNKLAASVNVLPQMDSTYVWKGELQHGKEHKIFITSLETSQREIKSAHPYALAEFPHFWPAF